MSEPDAPFPRPPGDQEAGITGQEVRYAQGDLIAWRSATFAPVWFSDALSEANSADRDARRREIVFAVASAECYLFEWVRDDVLKGDHRPLENYFPVKTARSIKDKWKAIPNELKAHGRIKESPNLGGGSAWLEFTDLVAFRNGLVHAQASRPETGGLPSDSLPVPSMHKLDELAPGWAAGVVRRLISELNTAAGTALPSWLK